MSNHAGRLRPAVFMDRDGCLTEEVGYVNHPSRIRLLPRTAAAVRRLNQAGIVAVMVTNQAGVARGYFSEETMHAANRRMVGDLEAGGARLDGLYVCMHHPREGLPPYRTECDCRKPRPGLLTRAAAELGIDLRASVMVGDRLSDVAAGQLAGTAGVLVLTGYGRGEWELRPPAAAIKPDHVAEDLLDAVDWALARVAGAGR
ncbi:MAG TPA: HAD family hydrolase [Methylomirabilota bacterium]